MTFPTFLVAVAMVTVIEVAVVVVVTVIAVVVVIFRLAVVFGVDKRYVTHASLENETNVLHDAFL